MQNQQEQINDLVSRLRERGMRLTPQRMAILKTLIGNKQHLSAEEIYARVHSDYPMIGLATIYKTIALLKDMGEIQVVNIHNQCARYESLDTHPHPHFVCSKCGAIIDLDHEILDDLPEKLWKKTGHQIVKTRLDFYGICHKCQSG